MVLALLIGLFVCCIFCERIKDIHLEHQNIHIYNNLAFGEWNIRGHALVSLCAFPEHIKAVKLIIAV